MSKISSLIYCIKAERISNQDGGMALNANTIMSILCPEYVPGLFSFSIVFTIQNIDISKNNELRIVFMDPSGNIVVDTNDITLPAEQKGHDEMIPEEYRGISLSMDLQNVRFESEGEYITEIYVNKASIYREKVYVKGKIVNKKG